jgi:hypothetical protein
VAKHYHVKQHTWQAARGPEMQEASPARIVVGAEAEFGVNILYLSPAAPLEFDSFLFAKSPKFIDGLASIGVPFAHQSE